MARLKRPLTTLIVVEALLLSLATVLSAWRLSWPR